MIIKEVDKSYFELYDSVSMNVDVKTEYQIERIEQGLGGFIFKEVPVKPYVKDLSQYEQAVTYQDQFDITHWRFYIAFDHHQPVGAATIAGKTEGMNMLAGIKDACVLWDLRVADGYKHQGIGQALFDRAVDDAKNDGYHQMMIECQNNNVPACKFYQKQGALLSKIDMHAYDEDPELRHEIQFVWDLKL